MNLPIHPAFFFFIGALFIPFLKGRLQKIFVLSVSLLTLTQLILLKPQTSLSFSLLDLKIVLLKADKLSLFVGYIFGLIGFLAILYSLHIAKNSERLFAFLYVGSSLGVVFAGDFLSLYLFWEIMALASTGLIIWSKRNPETLAAGWRYLIMHLMGGTFLFGGILLHYIASGSVKVGPVTSGLPYTLVLLGIGVNAAFILLHTWLPDAYPRASFTASVFLSVYTTKTAVYMLARVTPGVPVVAYIGGIMAVYGVTLALLQSNPRRLLSYHIVSQVGYMVAGIGIGGALGVNGGIFHLFNHILYKALLFMGIGAAIYRTGIEDLTELGGLARKMPITTIATVVAALSISGFPLFNGFASKGMVFEAAREHFPYLYLMLELAAVGTFLSFLKFTYFGFIRKNEALERKVKEVPANMNLAMGLTAFLCVLIGVYPLLMVGILPFATDFHFYTLEHVLGSGQLFFITAVTFILGIRFFRPHKREIYDFDYFYIKGAQGVMSLSGEIYTLNNFLEERITRFNQALLATIKPFSRLGEFIKKVVFALVVDMWLPRPVSPISSWKPEEVRKLERERVLDKLGGAGKKLGKGVAFFDLRIIDRLVNATGGLGEKVGKEVNNFDLKVVDRIVNGVGALGQRTGRSVGKFDLLVIDKVVNAVGILGFLFSKVVGWFDNMVVDGIVNGVALLTGGASKTLRPVQTGQVQKYAMVFFGGVALLFLIVLLVILLR